MEFNRSWISHVSLSLSDIHDLIDGEVKKGVNVDSVLESRNFYLQFSDKHNFLYIVASYISGLVLNTGSSWFLLAHHRTCSPLTNCSAPLRLADIVFLRREHNM